MLLFGHGDVAVWVTHVWRAFARSRGPKSHRGEKSDKEFVAGSQGMDALPSHVLVFLGLWFAGEMSDDGCIRDGGDCLCDYSHPCFCALL